MVHEWLTNTDVCVMKWEMCMVKQKKNCWKNSTNQIELQWMQDIRFAMKKEPNEKKERIKSDRTRGTQVREKEGKREKDKNRDRVNLKELKMIKLTCVNVWVV